MELIKNEELPLIYALRKRGKKVCNKKIRKTSTWSNFRKASSQGVVLYGTGEMFEYFCSVYGKEYDIKYAVDRNTKTKRRHERSGVEIYPLAKLLEDATQNDITVCMTMLSENDEVYDFLRKNGVFHCFSFGAMEYHKLGIKWKVFLMYFLKFYSTKYQMMWQINRQEQKEKFLEKRINLLEERIKLSEKRMNGIQQRQTERYLYLLHTNRVLNALIDKINDAELKKEQLSYIFTESFGNIYEPDFENPRTFNEKILARALYDDDPLHIRISDKYYFKEYIEEQLGKEYVIPLLGVWERPDDISLEELPDSFVLKATNAGDSSKIIVVKDKSSVDWQAVLERMRKWNRKLDNSYYYTFNRSLRDLEQRIIAEKYIGTDDSDYVYDYKFFCFHGEPKFFYVSTVEFMADGKPDIKVTYLDMKWNKLDIKRNHEEVDKLEKTPNFDKMIELSRKVAATFDFVRVDFMEQGEKIYLNELTLTPSGGLVSFEPVDWDYEFGKLW